MLNKKELEKAIIECENLPPTYPNCEKLATFYIIYDRLYGEKKLRAETKSELTIGDYGTSEFLSQINGKESKSIWIVIDELMSGLKGVMPKLYNATMQKIDDV